MKHIVVWPLKDEVSTEQKAEMKARLDALPDTISELRMMEVGIDDAHGTMSLITEFASKEDLAIYQAHPHHQAVVAFVRPLVAGRAVCDYDV